MSIWDDLIKKGKEMASEAIDSVAPIVTEKIGVVLKGSLEKKEDEKKKS